MERDLNFEVDNHKSLNKMLTGLIMDVRRGEVMPDPALVIAKVADKINKNNANALQYKKLSKHKKEIEFFEETI